MGLRTGTLDSRWQPRAGRAPGCSLRGVGPFSRERDAQRVRVLFDFRRAQTPRSCRYGRPSRWIESIEMETLRGFPYVPALVRSQPSWLPTRLGRRWRGLRRTGEDECASRSGCGFAGGPNNNRWRHQARGQPYKLCTRTPTKRDDDGAVIVRRRLGTVRRFEP
jgi:hypothetical protein